MFEMYDTPLEVLYLTLTISVGFIALLLVLALIHIVRILSNVRRVSEKAKDTIDLVNHYLWQPIKIMLMVLERFKEVSSSSKKKKK